MAKVLTVEIDGARHELHVLEAHGHFPGFGGSRSGLSVGKTASLVVRRSGRMGQHDTELAIDDPGIWSWIAKLINDGNEGKVKATPGFSTQSEA